VILGLLLQAPEWIVAAKLIFVLLFLFFTSPVSSHALVRSAFTTGLHPRLRNQKVDPRLFEGERVEKTRKGGARSDS
jgi:multisubunit Na+/H+ antiporter MnhG subunit